MKGGVPAALLAYGLWGLMPLYFRLMAPASALEVVAHRVVWSLVLLLAVLGASRQLAGLRHRLSAPLLARFALAALLVSINWVTYVWSVTHGHALDASLGYFLLPLVNVGLGVLVLGERLSRAEWIGVALAAAGVAWLGWASPRFPWVALVLAFSFGLYGLVKKRATLAAAEGMALETALIAVPALAVLVWLGTRGELAFGHVSRGLDAPTLARFALAALLVSINWITYFWAVTHGHALDASLGYFLLPLVNVALGVGVLGERLTRPEWIGVALAAAGVAWLGWASPRFP